MEKTPNKNRMKRTVFVKELYCLQKINGDVAVTFRVMCTSSGMPYQHKL